MNDQVVAADRAQLNYIIVIEIPLKVSEAHGKCFVAVLRKTRERIDVAVRYPNSATPLAFIFVPALPARTMIFVELKAQRLLLGQKAVFGALVLRDGANTERSAIVVLRRFSNLLRFRIVHCEVATGALRLTRVKEWDHCGKQQIECFID